MKTDKEERNPRELRPHTPTKLFSTTNSGDESREQILKRDRPVVRIGSALSSSIQTHQFIAITKQIG